MFEHSFIIFKSNQHLLSFFYYYVNIYIKFHHYMDTKNLEKDINLLIKGISNGDSEEYIKILNRVDEIVNTGNLPSKLSHYLSKRSYIKAIEFLKENYT